MVEVNGFSSGETGILDQEILPPLVLDGEMTLCLTRDPTWRDPEQTGCWSSCPGEGWPFLGTGFHVLMLVCWSCVDYDCRVVGLDAALGLDYAVYFFLFQANCFFHFILLLSTLQFPIFFISPLPICFHHIRPRDNLLLVCPWDTECHHLQHTELHTPRLSCNTEDTSADRLYLTVIWF